MVYLLHFDRPLSHARHLIVSIGEAAAESHRTVDLLNADDSGLLFAALRAEIGFAVTRTWPGGARIAARLRRQKRTARYCPACRRSLSAMYD